MSALSRSLLSPFDLTIPRLVSDQGSFWDDVFGLVRDYDREPSNHVLMKSLDYEDRREVLVELPGVTPENVDLEVLDEEAILTVDQEKTEENKHTLIRDSIKLQRRLHIPQDIDVSKIKAELSNGILCVTMPKKAPPPKPKPKKIKVATR